MNKNVEKKQLPMLDLKASFVPSTLNKEKRTVEAVLTTSLPVDRYSWDRGLYSETLSMEAGAIRTERVKTGAMPVLNNHGTGLFGGVKDLSDVIGVVENFRVEGDKAIATLRFADTPGVQEIWQKIDQGILKNISVGYRVYKYEDVTPKGVIEPQTLKAVDWELFEASVVAIPADYTAMMRSNSELALAKRAQLEMNDVEIIRSVDSAETTAPVKNSKKGVQEMDTENQEQPVAEAPVAEAPVEAQAPAESVPDAASLESAEKKGQDLELNRVLEIQKAVKAAKLSDEFGVKLIKDKVTLDKARALIIDEWSKKDQVDVKSQNSGIVVTRDEGETFRKSVQEAILHRANPGKNKLTDLGRSHAGYSLKEIARICVEREGIKTGGMGVMELVSKAFHTSGDFPAILADTINKSLRKAYDESPKTFMPWCNQGTAQDFKNITRTQLNNFPSLTKVTEAGEFKNATVSDGKEVYSLATYGAIVPLTRQAIINDDLSAFDRLSTSVGNAAAGLESDIVYGILTANAALADAIALFHANHANLGSGVISVAALGAARALMRKQKASGRALNLRPAFLIVPAALETIAQQYINQGLVADSPGNTNPFQNSMGLIVEPRLDDTSSAVWYMSASPSLIDTIEYSYLEGSNGVFTEVEQGFDVDGIRIKARHDFAAKAIDYRGLVKSTGV